MHNQASASITKIAVLASLLFISNAAYAQEGPKNWKHGFGIQHVEVSSGKAGAFSYSSSNLQAIEYAPRRDWINWSLQFSLGLGITDQDFSVGNVYNSSTTSYTSELDYYAGIALLRRVSSTLSLGPSYSHVSSTISGQYFNSSSSDGNFGFLLSIHGQDRKHAFEVNLAEEASTIGYRWAR